MFGIHFASLCDLEVSNYSHRNQAQLILLLELASPLGIGIYRA